MDDKAKALEEDTRHKFDGGCYDPRHICAFPDDPATAHTFSSTVLAEKLRLVEERAAGADVLDLCCGTALHLTRITGMARTCIGADFSQSFLGYAKANLAPVIGDRLVCANARGLPFADQCFDLVYCFSALYCIPAVDEAIAEIARVLRPGGTAILEMGNLNSLNTLVCRSYPDFANPCYIPVAQMKRIFRQTGLTIVQHRAFQLLPMWSDRPRWLGPLVSPRAFALMTRRIGGRMLDEWVCMIPFVRPFAFRHLFVCERA